MSQFVYLLNAMEAAAQADNPAEHDYGPKRRAVLDYVAKLESGSYVTVRSWIPVGERLPEPEQIEGKTADFVPVLFYTTTADWGNGVCAGRFSPEKKRAPWVSLQGSPYRRDEVSHWMPMPDGPVISPVRLPEEKP